MAHFAMATPNGPTQSFTIFLKYQESVKKVPNVSAVSELHCIAKEKFHAQIQNSSIVFYLPDREFGYDCELEVMEQIYDGAIVTIHCDESNHILSDSHRNSNQSIERKSSVPQDQPSNHGDAFLLGLQRSSIADIVRSLSKADSIQAFIWDITGQPGAHSQLSIEPGMDKLFQALRSIVQLKEGRYQEIHDFCKYLMVSVKSEGILVRWRRRFKPMLRGEKYWTVHMSWRRKLWRGKEGCSSWVIKNVNDILQPSARKHKHELQQEARTLLMNRISKIHNIPLWIKLGFFPPKHMWKTDFELIVLPHFKCKSNEDDDDAYNGFCQYWVKITFKDTCDPYHNYLCHWFQAHYENIIGWEWMIEPDLKSVHVSVRELTRSP
eukprot:94046_1